MGLVQRVFRVHNKTKDILWLDIELFLTMTYNTLNSAELFRLTILATLRFAAGRLRLG